MHILAVGIVVLDIVNVVDHYPSEDEEMRAESQYQSLGGNSANTLNVLSQLGHQCFWAGTLADDSNTAFIQQALSRCHIDSAYCKQITSANQPTSYITLNKANGSRTIVHHRNLPELDFHHFQKIPLAQFNWIHFEAREIAETAAMVRLAKKNHANIYVSIEIEKQRDNLDEIFNLADLYFFSKAYANGCGFNEPKAFLTHQQKYSPSADLLCTWGKEGAYALLKNGVFLSSGAYSPDTVIDTIGAGDTFNAAIIHQRSQKITWQKSLNFACQLAGKKCGQKGFDDLV